MDRVFAEFASAYFGPVQLHGLYRESDPGMADQTLVFSLFVLYAAPS